MESAMFSFAKRGKNDGLRAMYASAGIRTRVDGMKTRNDGPDYTTPAVICPSVGCS